MGCGHSKINIYPKKTRSKNNCKKTVATEKPETEEEETIENESELSEKIEDCDQRKTIKVKPFGGPLLAQTEISSSQQNFFKMLDEKIENGPDYDSASETERAAEAARLSALLKDWETASAGSRSLPSTPKRRPRPAEKVRMDGGARSAEVPRAVDRMYGQQLTQSVVHQSYGVAQQVSYRQVPYNNAYIHNPPHQVNVYPSAMQYQALSPMYSSQPTYQAPPRQYQNYNNSPSKNYQNNSSPKHIPYDPHGYNNPPHKAYGAKPGYTNGELIQQQMYNHQMQYQQAREYQQYKQNREQILLQQQGYASNRNYQSSVHIPIVQGDVNHLRNQYEPT